MNEDSKNLNINLNGTLTIAADDLLQLLGRLPSSESPANRPSTDKLEDHSKLPRLAFTMKETAEILGVSYITVHRLIQRGLLKSSLALRNKIIAKTEIERFLKDTSNTAY